jgi:FdhD protein
MHNKVGAYTDFNVSRWNDGELNLESDSLAEETPIALVYNGISHAVMMATPQDLEDFALGFSITEGIIANRHELYGVELECNDSGWIVNLDIATERFAGFKDVRRAMVGRTGCGLCGVESLSQVFKKPTKPIHCDVIYHYANILHAVRQLPHLQTLQQITGASHACAFANQDGHVMLVREDVGRHNAMDKLIGALAKQDYPKGFIITTSRASYEMVQKVAMAGYGLLAAVSAPTALAVKMAEELNVSLIGFAREYKCVAYAHAQLIQK